MVYYLRFIGSGAPITPNSLTMQTAPFIGGKAETKRALVACPGYWTHTPTKRFPWPLVGGRWWKNGVATSSFDDVWTTDNDIVGDVFEWQEIVTNDEGTKSYKTASVTLATYSATDVLASSLGAKPLKTTGTISAGNLSLMTVADGSQFATGDSVIIELGGEAGAGMRGTMGVGGAWPPLSYVDEATLLADTTKAAGTYAFARDTGAVFVSNGSGWISSSPYDYYYGTAYPLALTTTITKSGNDFTLAVPATVPVTGATVWLNNTPKVQGTLNGTNTTLIFDTGEFAVASYIYVANQNDDVTIQGAGKLLTKLTTPKGVPSGGIFTNSGTNPATIRRPRLRDLGIRGNAGLNGYAFGYADATSRGLPSPAYIFEVSGEGVASDILVEECWAGPSQSRSVNCWGVRNTVRLVAPTQRYFQWLINLSDCDGGGYIDAVVDSDWMASGIEFFRCFRPAFIRPVSRNGAFSTNTSGYWRFISPRIHIEANKQYPMPWTEAQGGPFQINYSVGKPFIDCNGNVGNTSGQGVDLLNYGGHIVDLQMTIDGFINTDRQLPIPIIVAPNYKLADGVSPSVSIHGKGGVKGFIKQPDYQDALGGTGNQSRWAIASDGTMSVWDMILTGLPAASYGVSISMAGDGLIQNCVVWSVSAGAGATLTGNQTPSAFVAGGGTLP